MSLFAAHLTDKEIEAWREVPHPWGREVAFGARGWPVSPRSGRPRCWGDSGDPGLSWVLATPPGSAAWCQHCRLPVTTISRCLGPRYVLSPLPMCQSLSHPLCWQPWKVGWAAGGGGVLFISAQEKLCLVAAHGVDSQGPDSGSSAS